MIDFISDKYCPIIKVEFLTPLRIKRENKIEKEGIELIDILSSINKRFYDISNSPYQKLQISKEYKIVSKHLSFKELTRKSNKQKRLMQFGGLMGEMIISGLDKKSYELLRIGEIIGVGKQTVFGLGKIKIEDIS